MTGTFCHCDFQKKNQNKTHSKLTVIYAAKHLLGCSPSRDVRCQSLRLGNTHRQLTSLSGFLSPSRSLNISAHSMEIFTYPSTTSYMSGDGSVLATETKVSRPANARVSPGEPTPRGPHAASRPPGPGHAGPAARALRRAHAVRQQHVPTVQ